MITPVDKEFYKMMKNRFPYQLRKDRNDFFYTETRILFGRLMSLIVETEHSIERWRHKLNNMSRFTIRGVFDRIDILRRNFLTKDDVWLFTMLLLYLFILILYLFILI